MREEDSGGKSPVRAEECAALPCVDLPPSEVRKRIAILYQEAVAERRGACGAAQSRVMAFIDACALYVHSELRALRTTHPFYRTAHDDLAQNFSVACLHLLDRPQPLEDTPTCCVGTQIYNTLNWQVRSMGQQMKVQSEGNAGSDVLEEVLAERVAADLEAGERDDLERDMPRLERLLRKQKGAVAGDWLRARYLGYSREDARRQFGISSTQAQYLEQTIERFLTIMNWQK